MNKFRDMLGSSNFLVTLFAIISMVFSYNDVDLGLTPEQLAESFNGAEVGALIATAFMLFLNPLVKIVKSATENGFNFSFFKSTNFWVQFASAILLLLGTYFDKMDMAASVMGSLTMNSVNLLAHSVTPPKEVLKTDATSTEDAAIKAKDKVPAVATTR